MQLLGQGGLRTVNSNTLLGEFNISYTGVEEKLYVDKASNGEFKFSSIAPSEVLTSGIVTGFTETANAPVPLDVLYDLVAEELDYDKH